jgi:hypothetical protein
MSIVYTSSFNTKNITITVPRALQSGAKQAYLNYSGERLIMQSAVAMTTTFGLNCADKFGPPEYSVDLSFRGHDQRVDLKEFMDTLAQLDEFMINEGVKNSKLWFKAELSRDVVKAFYTPTLKYSKDKDGNLLSYPPNIKLKLRRTNDQFDTKFYDVNGTPYKDVPVEDMLVKHSQLTAIMECGGVWFAGSKFGLSWRAKQIAVHKLPEKMGEFAFKGLSSATVEQKEVDDDAVFAAPTASSLTASSLTAVSAASASASSVVAALMPQAQAQQQDEDEDGEDMEPVPPPKPVMKKKVVVAKK